MASITLDIRDAIKRLSAGSKKLENMSGLFKNIADLELSQTMLRFKDQKDPEGKDWEDPITIRRDGAGGRRGGFTQEQSWRYVLKSNYHAVPPGFHWFDKSRGDKILLDTGTLMRSIGIAYGKDYAIVGTNLEYAEKHQEGRGVKRRAFLGINDKTGDNVNLAVDAFLKGLLK